MFDINVGVSGLCANWCVCKCCSRMHRLNLGLWVLAGREAEGVLLTVGGEVRNFKMTSKVFLNARLLGVRPEGLMMGKFSKNG